MNFLGEMKQRTMVAQITHEDELAQHLSTKPRSAYVGMDPTGESLHVGHLLPIMALRRWQKAGHRAIALMGGGTAMVGDPTGKSELRQMLTVELIDQRIEKIKRQLAPLLDFSTPERGVVVNNADWLRTLEYMPFLREIGSHFSVNRMLTAECFKQRLEKGLSFLEFNYMILQSYDFYHLFKEYNCTVQMGGDDQWSNMLGGMELVRRKEREQAFCLTVPLLVTSGGKKMGKTEKGAIWIDPSLTPPYELFQYFRNVDDDMVEACLNYFSDLPIDEIKHWGSRQGKEINQAKVVLAFEITKLLHGEEEAAKAKTAASSLFASGDVAHAVDAPEFEIELVTIPEHMNIVDLLVAGKVAATKSEARRLIEQGGIMINGIKIGDMKHMVETSLLLIPEGLLVRKGKKHYSRLLLKR